MIILQRLIEQAKHPNGLIGSIMLRIMNVAHRGMTSWLIESGAIKNGDIVLDIGCGVEKQFKHYLELITMEKSMELIFPNKRYEMQRK